MLNEQKTTEPRLGNLKSSLFEISAPEAIENEIRTIFYARLPTTKQSTKFLEIALTQYKQSERHYHNSKHILHCLIELQLHKKQLNITKEQEQQLIVAIVGHDVIYDIEKNNNEEQSANFTTNLLGHEFLLAHNLILATKHSTHIPTSKIQTIIKDVDLSILGQSQLVYQQYSQKIRQEYAQIPEETYNFHRINFLKKLLEQEIFINSCFKKYEAQAKDNILAEVLALSNGQ